MFMGAISFNGDISEWNVSSVNDMDSMFMSAISFKQTLCGAAWVHSNAGTVLMFKGSPGLISRIVCMPVQTLALEFSPLSKAELNSATAP